MKQARTWSKDEDELLRRAVARQEGESTINWHEVASSIEGRNNKECRKRWVYSLEPSINKGSWEPTEDERLRSGVQSHGTKWAEVSRVVGSRHPDQCSKRWHEVLKPNINRERWSLIEDNILRNAVSAHGRKWIEIVERYFPERTPIATRNRYFHLQKQDAEGEAAAETHEGVEDIPTESPTWSHHSSGYMQHDLATSPYMLDNFGAVAPQLAGGMGVGLQMHPQASMMQGAPMGAYYPQYVQAGPPPMGFDPHMASFAYGHPHIPR